jgi:hypothetical protein
MVQADLIARRRRARRTTESGRVPDRRSEWSATAPMAQAVGVTTADPFPSTELERDDEVIRGAARRPRQMLADQEYDGHASVHDDEVAGKLGLAGAPIEGPTHFSQFDPLGFELWGQRWFESGCISAHFQTMVVEGESVVASIERVTAHDGVARIDAAKDDGTPVLTGTASVDPDASTELRRRLTTARERGPGELFIVDQVEVGPIPGDDRRVTVDATTSNGGHARRHVGHPQVPGRRRIHVRRVAVRDPDRPAVRLGRAVR